MGAGSLHGSGGHRPAASPGAVDGRGASLDGRHRPLMEAHHRLGVGPQTAGRTHVARREHERRAQPGRLHLSVLGQAPWIIHRRPPGTSLGDRRRAEGAHVAVGGGHVRSRAQRTPSTLGGHRGGRRGQGPPRRGHLGAFSDHARADAGVSATGRRRSALDAVLPALERRRVGARRGANLRSRRNASVSIGCPATRATSSAGCRAEREPARREGPQGRRRLRYRMGRSASRRRDRPRRRLVQRDGDRGAAPSSRRPALTGLPTLDPTPDVSSARALLADRESIASVCRMNDGSGSLRGWTRAGARGPGAVPRRGDRRPSRGGRSLGRPTGAGAAAAAAAATAGRTWRGPVTGSAPTGPPGLGGDLQLGATLGLACLARRLDPLGRDLPDASRSG